jgi:hypothetical protein
MLIFFHQLSGRRQRHAADDTPIFSADSRLLLLKRR